MLFRSVRRRPSGALLLRLFVARQRAGQSLPRAEKIEAAIFLREPDRLIDDSALFVVVAHLDVTRHREILAHRMAFEAVIGENPPQVRMVRKRSEEHTSELQSLMRISY